MNLNDSDKKSRPEVTGLDSRLQLYAVRMASDLSPPAIAACAAANLAIGTRYGEHET